MRLLILIYIQLCILLVNSVSAQTYLFVGSYTEGEKDSAVYVYRFDTLTGSLDQVYRAANLVNPSFITISEDGKFLYACTETKLDKNGSLSVFKIHKKNGRLTYLNKQDAGGRNPVHVVADIKGRYVINSNYTDASISVFKQRKSGRLLPFKQKFSFEGESKIKSRQAQAHIHSSNFSPDGNFLFSPDLGADKIRVLRCDKDSLQLIDSLDVDCAAGSGPRHLVFHPNGLFLYCVEELSGSISSYSYHYGRLVPIDHDFSYSKLQESYGSSDIHISKDGKFLYASNRWSNENTISIFSIDSKQGTLTLVGHQPTYGDHPRSFVLDPSNNFLLVANQASGNIVVFRRNATTGGLIKTEVEIKISLPSSLKMIHYK